MTDWREVVWDASFCWDQDWTFFQCCRNGRDLDVLPGILQGLAKVRGHPDCWQPPEEGPVYHDNCCVLNANLDKVPRFDHMIWQIRMPETEQILNVVQGQVLETWESRGIIPPEVVPKVGLQGNGEGLVWEAGESALALAVTEFGWRSARRIRFLEVASSVGAPSLVALAKGFHVWSSDLRDESAWQRWAGARASSFTEAQLKRFRTPRLDLLDERTWPHGLFFDVIFLGSPFFMVGPTSEQQAAFCRSFQRLLALHLAPQGLGMMFLNPVRLEPTGGNIRQTYADDCLKRSSFAVMVHQPVAEGRWHSQWLQEDTLEDFDAPLHLPLVFTLRRRNASIF